MIFEKEFEVTIIINNTLNFCINKYQNVMIELNNIYKNKCYMSSYILKINKIINMSSCRIINSNSSGNGVIDVKFTADVFTLELWDILVGVEIEQNQSLIIGKYKNDTGVEINITFKPTNIHANTLSLKQLLPVRIVKAIHKPNYNQIIAAGVLLTCDRKNTIYKVKGELSKSLLPEINSILNNIKEELKLRMNLMKSKSKEILFFESLLYSYKSTNSTVEKIKIDNNIVYENYINKEIKNMNLLNIFDIVGTDLTGFWSRPLNIYRSSPFLVMTNEESKDYIESTPSLLIIEIAKHILNFLVAIREFTEIYNTPELIKKHENIWNMMRQVQL